MKKLFLITTLTVFSFSLNANTKVEKTITLQDNGCAEYAVSAANAEEDSYGEYGCSNVYFEVAMEYYDMCNESGGAGNMLDPIFL
jgi:hypothetical protein